MRSILLALVIIVVVFGGYEIVERTLLRGLDPSIPHWLHMARGIGTSLLVAAVLIRPLARGMRMPLAKELPIHATSAPVEGDLRSECLWLVRLRWIASVAVLVYVVSGLVSHLFPRTPPIPLMAAALSLPLTNLGFQGWSSRSRLPRRVLQVQIIFDLLLLSVLLHYTGGIQNPLIFLSVFHVILAGILLSRRDAYGVALLAIVLLSSLAVREMTGLLPRYPIAGIPQAAHSPVLVGAVVIALIAVLVGTASFTTSIMGILRRREAELVRAGKMAAIGELAGGVAHEINNPLAIISGKVESLRDLDGKLPESAKHDLDKIGKHVHRIAAITKGLLSYSRPFSGEKRPTGLNRVVQDSWELILARAREQGVHVELRQDSESPEIAGNATELTQVVVNLANNALDSMSRGGMLRIRTERRGGEAVLEVSDTGRGMTREVQRRIFEPFFTTKTESGGTGLGLAICHGIAREHGGRIEVESEPGRGSVFRVFFPAILQEEAV